ncbi:carbohydrate ABC transporter permease [Planobispora longispora]|uniref:carbohydrate ABC transporter permease n=1 Tax=Planobispora longispora TaxID=28887 RepID=UPI001EF6D6CD|nr:carbohydrate ABC transporter permease [Planobispora longispora]
MRSREAASDAREIVPGARRTTAGTRRTAADAHRIAYGARRGVLNVAAATVLAVMIFPVYWMFATAFKPTAEIQNETPGLWPAHPTLEHFATAVGADGFWTFWRNSLAVTGAAVLLALVVALLSAFAVARMRWRGRGPFIVMIFAAQMAPWEALLVPMFVIARDAELLDSLAMLTGVYFMVTLPFTIVTLRGFLAAVPAEVEEAALVDGCTRFAAFRRVIFPLLAPGLMATSLFGFITAWNEFAFVNVLIIKDQDKRTLPVWLSSFRDVFGTDWGATMAAATLFALPVLVLFLFLQRRVGAGMISGAVKG